MEDLGNEVTRAEGQRLLRELKEFAYEESPPLRQNFDCGLEIAKSFIHDDPVPLGSDRLSKEMCKSTFGFSVYRVPPARNKRSFDFTLSAAIERTLPHLDNTRYNLILPDILDRYDGFREAQTGLFTENSATIFNISDHDVREIQVEESYSIVYAGDLIYSRSAEDIIYSGSGSTAYIDPSESEDYHEKMYIPDPIEHEQILGADNVIANLGFWALVEPFAQDFEQGVSYNSAAEQMRAVIHSLRTGELMLSRSSNGTKNPALNNKTNAISEH